MADEEWIERLARSLCREAGLDPDATVGTAGSDLEGEHETLSVSAWTIYVGRAQAHVTAARALNMIR